MARILIVTAWYYPFIHPRAHRWTSLAEYWAAQGHRVEVVCARRSDCPDQGTVNQVQIHRTGFDSLKELFYYFRKSPKGRGRVGAGVQRPSWSMRLLSILYTVVWKKIYFPDDAGIWYFPARKAVLDKLAKNSYDALITVSLPFTGHLIGLAAKRKYPGLHWLADMGDPFTIQAKAPNNTFLYRKISANLERQVLNQADAVVVTHARAAQIYGQHFGAVAAKIQVVPPLLHPEFANTEMRPSIASRKKTDRRIHLGYFGALYAPIRTPAAFLQLLEQSFASCPELRSRLQVHFYGDIFPEFYNSLSRVEVVQLHGLQSRQAVRTAMQRMDILVNIGNTTNYQLPSKVVDYLAAGKPVLHLSYVDDDPFVEVWGSAPGLFVVKVASGRFSSEALGHWLEFLDKLPAPFSREVLRQRLHPFLLPEVAQTYARLIPGLPVAVSTEEIVATPVHH